MTFKCGLEVGVGIKRANAELMGSDKGEKLRREANK